MAELRLIGAGLPRTATTTQLFALEQLDHGPCYHMRDLLADLERGLPLWESVAQGDADWQRIFGDARSAVDWPSARYYRELMDEYPHAKVLLSASRAPSRVAKSCVTTCRSITVPPSATLLRASRKALTSPILSFKR